MGFFRKAMNIETHNETRNTSIRTRAMLEAQWIEK
jgi:hypothetical protein